MRSLAKKLVYGISLIFTGMLCVVVVFYALLIARLPDLKPWHSVDLEEDFHAGTGIDDLAGYLQVETRAFAEMEREILDQIEAEDRFVFNRFYRGSQSDPASVPVNWNRTYELDATSARGGALLLHGLSDSPYSLRHVGAQLNANGWQVLGMRMPAHGTAPGALRAFSRDDAREATRIGVRHLRQRLGPHKPILIVGYSNGATLAADYVLSAIADPALPRINGLILMSPAFEIAPIAALAVWQARIGELLGIDELAWQTVTPEFDPYKYNSFAVRAGDQIYRLTQEVDRKLRALPQQNSADQFPPTLVFQSLTDATVRPAGVVTRLLDRLGTNGSTLVLYDVNRHAELLPLYTRDTGRWVEQLLSAPTPYSVTVLTNRSPDSGAIDAVTRPATKSGATREPLELSWPVNTFALSHVSIPFPPHDTVYGADGERGPLLAIGRIEARGETGVLAIPAALLSRLRHNPFYSYQARRIDLFARQIATQPRKQKD